MLTIISQLGACLPSEILNFRHLNFLKMHIITELHNITTQFLKVVTKIFSPAINYWQINKEIGKFLTYTLEEMAHT